MRIQTKHIINSLPLVADVLGSKYGIRVEIGGDTAATNGRTIFLPSLPLDSGEDVLNMARGFIDHESAHLRHTDFDLLNAADLTPVEKFLWNILEDCRVEKKLAAIFPGCKTNLEWLCRNHLLRERVDNRELTENPALLILEWTLLYVRAWDVREFRPERDRSAHMLDRLFPGLRTELEPVLDTASMCGDTKGCIDAARELARIISDYNPPEPTKEQEQADVQNSGEQEEDSETQPDSSENGNPDVSPCDGRNADDSEREGQGSSGPREDKSEISENDSVDDGHAGNSAPVPSQDVFSGQKGSIPRGKSSGRDTAAAVRELQEFLANPNLRLPKDLGETLREALRAEHRQGGEQLRVATPVPVRNHPFPPQELADARRATTALRTRLQALLQSTVLVRNRNSRTGRVDSRRLARLAVNDPRVFMRKGKRQGMNTAVHILLDSSGSMSGAAITLACKACFAVASALDAVHGVGVAVTSFPGGVCDTVAPLLKHKERPHDRFHIAAVGNTPLAEAVWWVIRQMRSLTEERKIILLITDGMPNSLPLAQNAIMAARDAGLEVYGIGINTQSVKNLLPGDACRIINNLPELAPAMFSILQNALLHHPQGRAA
jgi:cobalamin biosynthesis protein CobT